MRPWVLAIPILGACAAAAVPLLRHVQGEHQHAVAIDTLRRVRAAQDAVNASTGAFATDLASLITGCDGSAPALPAGVVEELAAAGYELTLRAERQSRPVGADCHGLPSASDYYIAAAPQSAASARLAFAARARGDIYVFFDGVPPLESEIASGLATRLADLEAFKIP